MMWHIVTPEYPPVSGGVSHYVYSLAGALSQAGDEVHVWSPAAKDPAPVIAGVRVHCEPGAFRITDLWRTGRALNRFPEPRRILVQWVPHGYRYRSMNIAFCLWVWLRSMLRGDSVELMIHEAFLEFRNGKWRQNVAAAVHRIMMLVLLQSTRKVWTSTLAIGPLCKPYALGRAVTFEWLPIPSSVPVSATDSGIAQVRRAYTGAPQLLIGHFGTYGGPITSMLRTITSSLLGEHENACLLLIGQNSDEFRSRLVAEYPQFAERIRSSGHLSSFQDLSAHIAACDLMIQPYPDGVTTRRTTVMAGISHGRPVVTTAGRATEDFWKEAGAVALVPADDTDAFLDAVRTLLADENARTRLGDRAASLYRSRLDIRETVTQLRGSAPPVPQLVAG